MSPREKSLVDIIFFVLSKFSILGFFCLRKILVFNNKIVLGKNFVLNFFLSLLGDFWFYGLLALPGDFWFLILRNFWKWPNEIVPYDTDIIFRKHLGAMLFAQNISKKYKTFLKCRSLNNFSDYVVFYWHLFPWKYDFVQCTYVNSPWNRFLVEATDDFYSISFLFHIVAYNVFQFKKTHLGFDLNLF